MARWEDLQNTYMHMKNYEKYIFKTPTRVSYVRGDKSMVACFMREGGFSPRVFNRAF